MGAIVAFFGNIITTVLGFGSTILLKIGGLLGKIGIRLLSFEWIKKIVDIFKKILEFIKKYLLNQKVISILKLLFTVILIVLTGVQLYFVVNTLITEVESAKQFILSWSPENIIFTFVFVVGIVVTIEKTIESIVGLFRKVTRIDFIPSLFLTYLLILFFNTLSNEVIVIKLFESITFINIIAIVIAVFAFFRLFDQEHQPSIFGILLCALAIIIIFLTYRNGNFALFMNYNLVNEAVFPATKINFISLIRGLFQPETALGLENVILSFGESVAEISSKFLASLAFSLDTLYITLSNILPYALLSLTVGFTMALLNDRFHQITYLNKTIQATVILFFASLAALLAALVLSWVFPEAALLHEINVKESVLTLIIILALIIFSTAARALIQSRVYRTFKPMKK